jgi:hypothetical protein
MTSVAGRSTRAVPVEVLEVASGHLLLERGIVVAAHVQEGARGCHVAVFRRGRGNAVGGKPGLELREAHVGLPLKCRTKGITNLVWSGDSS